MSRRNLTTSILGDSGQAEATVVPNLESLNTGNDQYVQAVSDTSEFNVYGQMKIYDNYWDTFFARHIVNAANTGTTTINTQNAVIQSNTEGWARADHMMLQVPIEFQYCAEASGRQDDVSKDLVVPLVCDSDDMNDNEIQVYNRPSDGFSIDELWGDFLHPWYALINVFTKLRLLIGNNGQQVQKQIETEPFGMKVNMSNLRAGPVITNAMRFWGMEKPMLQPTHGDLPDYVGVSGSEYTIIGPTNSDEHAAELYLSGIPKNDAYLRMLSKISWRDNDGSSTYTVKAYGEDAEPALRNILQWNKRRILSLPLQCIMPFFRGPKFLPPDFRFKFEIETLTSPILIARTLPVFQHEISSQNGKFAADVDIRAAYRQIKAQALTNGIELTYPWHVLRQPVQAAISSMWLQRPFLFNYETIQITEITPTTGTQNIHFAISISTQRPTELEIYLLPQNSDNWKVDNWLAADFLKYSSGNVIRVKDSPTFRPKPIGAETNTANSGSLTWTDLEIMFSGRTAYRLRNDLFTNKQYGNQCPTPQEIMCNLWQEQSMRSTASEFNSYSATERMIEKTNCPLYNTHTSEKVMKLIIQPGGWTDRGVISSRQGATTITIDVAFSNQLSANDRFVVVRTNPEQCVFDSDKNVTLIQWPAIKNNGGYLLPDITAAP